MMSEVVTSSDIDALIRRAELDRGRAVGQRELLLRTMFNVALAFIDLETIRPRMMNNKISVVFRSAQDRTLQAKAEITIPTE